MVRADRPVRSVADLAVPQEAVLNADLEDLQLQAAQENEAVRQAEDVVVLPDQALPGAARDVPRQAMQAEGQVVQAVSVAADPPAARIKCN